MQGRSISRRLVVAAGLVLAGVATARAEGLLPAGRLLAFDLWRGPRKLGRHSLAFTGDASNFAVNIDTAVKVGMGPLTFYRYKFHATETWQDGQFSGFQSRAETNGKVVWVSAARSPSGVMIKTPTTSHLAPAATLPLTHWNMHALTGPLFDVQTGASLHETVTSQPGQIVRLANGMAVAATRYSLAGDLEAVAWYDAQDELTGLRVKVMDGSHVDYRRAT